METTGAGSSDTGRREKPAREEKGRAQCRVVIPAVGPITRTSVLRGRDTGVGKAAAMEVDMEKDMVRVVAATMARVAMGATVAMVAMGPSRGNSSSNSNRPSTKTTRTRLSCLSTTWSRGSSRMVSTASAASGS